MQVFCMLLNVPLIAGAFGCKPPQKSDQGQSQKTASKQGQEVDAKTETIRQAGYPVILPELEQWIPTPPDQNAATRYAAAFAALIKPPAPTPGCRA